MKALKEIDLTGLQAAPSQVWGGVRLVPLLREHPVPRLRLTDRLAFAGGPSIVDVGDKTSYVSYIPHAFVASWGIADADGNGEEVAYGSQLLRGKDTLATAGLAPIRAMVRKEGRRQLRFLPLHLALEGLLALHFGGPSIMWEEWNRRALAQGLSPRVEKGYLGQNLPGFDKALRVFEIHHQQCGIAVYFADALAGIFVTPHPHDYRALHTTLLENLYGDEIMHYAKYPGSEAQQFAVSLDANRVATLADLTAELRRATADWDALHPFLAQGFLDATYREEVIRSFGGFTLSRFLPDFTLDHENHLGERITAEDGTLAYLNTFRLSKNQVRRTYLLNQLSLSEWNINAVAIRLGLGYDEVVARIDGAGFGYLLRPEVLDAVRSRARRMSLMNPSTMPS